MNFTHIRFEELSKRSRSRPVTGPVTHLGFSTPMADMPLARQDLAAEMAAFTAELRTVTAALDPEAGWFAAFARRRRAELDAWLSGRELPPWDAVADLLQDLAVLHGSDTAESAGWRIRGRYEASARAQDAQPGGREGLLGRLAELDREEPEVHRRGTRLAEAERSAQFAGRTQEAERLAALRLWVQDDEERIRARRAELRARLASLPAGPEDGAFRETPAGADGGGPRRVNGQVPQQKNGRGVRYGQEDGQGEQDRQAQEQDRQEQNRGDSTDGGEAGDGKPPKRPKAARRPRGARFAGLAEDTETTAPAPEPEAVAEAEAAPVTPPGGSRFAGAVRGEQGEHGERERRGERQGIGRRASRRQRALRLTEEDRSAAAGTAEQLRKLRAQGQSGQAHMVLCGAAAGPASRLAALVGELEESEMASDVLTLLWEAASLPPQGLALAAEALADTGRERDCEQLLRQGAARPPGEAGQIAEQLWRAGRTPEALTLLTSMVRAKTAEEAVLAAAVAPDVVAPLLLDASWQVSPRHHYAVISELRRAGVA